MSRTALKENFAPGTSPAASTPAQYSPAGTGSVNEARLELFVNDTKAAAVGDVPVNPKCKSSNLAVGQERDAINHPGHESFNGEIARFMIFDRPSDDEKLKALLSSLGEQYGIASSP